METKIKSVKEKINNSALLCSLDGAISRIFIWSNGVGFIDLHDSPVPYLFLEQISSYVEVLSISFDTNSLIIDFIMK